MQSALASGEALAVLWPTIVGGLLIVFSMWWFYFDRPVHDLLTSFRKAFIWGYGHYLVFAAAAAVGALTYGVSSIFGDGSTGPLVVSISLALALLWLFVGRLRTGSTLTAEA